MVQLLWEAGWQFLIRLNTELMLVVKNPPPNTGDLRDTGLIPGSGRYPGVGPGNPLQYSCLETLMDWTEEPGGLQYVRSQRGGHD